MPKTLCTAFAFILIGGGTAWAAAPLPPQQGIKLPIIPIANGCGRGFFRTIEGDCQPNAQFRVGPGGRAVNAGPPCPRGYRRDPDPQRPVCYPVY